MKILTSIALTLLIASTNLFAASATCPELSKANHPDPLKAGWQISPFSSQNSANGIHIFQKASITLQNIGGNNTVSCAYKDGLVLLEVGCFKKPHGSNNWFNNGLGADICTGTVDICKFESLC